MIATTLQKPKTEIYYPESDGEPLAETGLHARETIALFSSLRDFFRKDADVYVSVDHFLYFVEGDPTAVVSPDIYVVKGVANHLRDTYKVWEQGGRVPCATFEITSKSTRKVDTGKKRMIYAELGVHEYFLFDPMHDYLNPPLQGYRLIDGMYVPMVPEQNGALRSTELGLLFRVSPDGLLRVMDGASGTVLPRAEEMCDSLDFESRARREAEAVAQREADARLALEGEVARLKAELQRLNPNQKPA